MQALTVKVGTLGEDGVAALKAEVHRLRSEESPLRSHSSEGLLREAVARRLDFGEAGRVCSVRNLCRKI